MLAFCIATILTTATVIAVAANRQREEEVNDALVVEFATIPPAARKAISKLAGLAKIEKLEVEDEDGVKVYEAAWTQEGVEYEATVTEDGAVVETEEVVAVRNTPKAVQQAAVKAFPKGVTVKVERKTVVFYEFAADIDGKENEILLAPTGQRVEMEYGDVEDDDDENDDDDDNDEDKG